MKKLLGSIFPALLFSFGSCSFHEDPGQDYPPCRDGECPSNCVCVDRKFCVPPEQSADPQVCDCPAPKAICGPVCIDIQSDPKHCGSCPNICLETQVCSSGVCVDSCKSPNTYCGKVCTDLQTDVANCNKCGNDCSRLVLTPTPHGAPKCRAGKCEIVCNAAFGNCNDGLSDGCEIQLGTFAHCASCETCQTGQVCKQRLCTSSGCAPLTDCDGTCVDLKTDPLRCGACGINCFEKFAHAKVACTESACSVVVCKDNFENCDGSPDGSCETDLNIDQNNCGTCGKACAEDESCQASSCAVACQNGLAYCYGKCVDTRRSAENCGKCGNKCSVPHRETTCKESTCLDGPCIAPYADCDLKSENGCETNLSNDSANCRTCGTECTTTTKACSSSTCVTGEICIVVGTGKTRGIAEGMSTGPVYAAFCSSCSLEGLSTCRRFRVCESIDFSCDNCLTGFADGEYNLIVFIDTDSNAEPDLLPKTGDAISLCKTQHVSAGANKFTFTTADFETVP